MAGRQVINAVVGLIKAGVDTMVKFLSSLPALAEDVRKMANKGSRLDISTGRMRELQRQEKIFGLEEGAIGNFYYSLHRRFADIVSAGGSVESALGGLAPILAQGPHIGVIEDIVNRSISSPNAKNIQELGDAILNGILTVSLQGKTTTRPGGGMDPLEALLTNIEIMSRAVGGEDLGYALSHLFRNVNRRHDVIGVARGGEATFGNTTFNNYDTLGALLAAILGDPSLKNYPDAATSAEVRLLEEISQRLLTLGADFKSALNAIQISIGARLGELVRFGEWMTKGIIALSGIPGGEAILADIGQNNYNRNVEYERMAKQHAEIAGALATSYGIEQGFLPARYDEHGNDLYDGDDIAYILEEHLWRNQHIAAYTRTGLPINTDGRFIIPEGQLEEWLQWMILLENEREAQNVANKTEAMNRGYRNMGERQTYETLDKNFNKKDEHFTVRSMDGFIAVQTPSTAFFQQKAVNNVKRQTDIAFRMVTDAERAQHHWQNGEYIRAVLSGITNPRYAFAAGEELVRAFYLLNRIPGFSEGSPTNLTRSLRGANRLVDYQTSDGINPATGLAREGVDYAVIGEGRTNRSNVFQEDYYMQGMNKIMEIQAQVGKEALYNIAQGTIEVVNKLVFGEQKYSIDLNYLDEYKRVIKTETVSGIHNFGNARPNINEDRWRAVLMRMTATE